MPTATATTAARGDAFEYRARRASAAGYYRRDGVARRARGRDVRDVGARRRRGDAEADDATRQVRHGVGARRDDVRRADVRGDRVRADRRVVGGIRRTLRRCGRCERFDRTDCGRRSRRCARTRGGESFGARARGLRNRPRFTAMRSRGTPCRRRCACTTRVTRSRETRACFGARKRRRRRSEESYEFDDEANLAPATYDARALLETLRRLAGEGATHIRDAASAIASDVEIAKVAIERRFLADLDERLQPMIAATKRYRRRSSGTNGGKPAIAPTIGGDRLLTASESRDAYPYTERALVAALRLKLESFERSIWMCFRVAISRARDASLDELTAHVRDARSSETAIFQTTFDFETSTLVPSSDAFERAIRDGAAAWTSSSLGERVGDAVDLRSLEDDEFQNRVDEFCDLVRDAFASAQEALLVVATRLREKSPDAVADADGGDDESSMIERLSEIVARSNAFKKEVDALPGSIRPNDGAIAVDIVSLKRALKPVACGDD